MTSCVFKAKTKTIQVKAILLKRRDTSKPIKQRSKYCKFAVLVLLYL
jgi:hypothetical protein